MNKNKNLRRHFFIYTVVTLFTVLVFLLQRSSMESSNLLFLIIYMMIFFVFAELYSYIAGIYIVFFIFILQLFSSFYLTSLLLILLTAYYYLIKLARYKQLKILNQKEKYFRSLTNFTPLPIILKNSKGEVLFASESINDLLALKKGLPVGENISNFLFPQDIGIYENHLKEVSSEPYSKKSVELRMKKNDTKNEWIWVRHDSVNLLKHEHIKAIVSSVQDITFQKELDREKIEIINEEKKARSLAEKAVQDRDEFLSIASHELKTPLTTVLLQLQTTLRRISTQSLADFSGEDLLKSLQIAEKQSQRLSTLIIDLLNVSVASSGRITLNSEKVNLNELVRSIVEKYEEEIKISGSRIQTLIGEENIIGRWDPVRLEQAITNLFTNALKYGEGNKITVSLKADDKNAYIKITDRGEGISQDQQKEIFEPFKRANNNSKTLGLGVGLFITKQIVDAHKGTISLESKPERGSTFLIKLPL